MPDQRGMDATENITPQTIEAMTEHAEYGGFGYLGHSDRTHESDRALATAANLLGLTADDVFLWANSRYARHAMDVMPKHPVASDFEAAMMNPRRGLPALRAEVAR